MSADSDNLRSIFAEQLASFDDRLATKADDLQMLADIQEGIGRLLEASGRNEAEIRRTLQERYEAGQLRKETFQLVKSMLDRYVTEQIPTSQEQVDKASQFVPEPAPAEEREPANDDAFTTTDVLSTDAFPGEDPDTRVQIGSVLRDRFMLQEQVSGGSMGVVYKALDRRLAEAGSEAPWVAIKILSPQLSRNGNALRALQQEAAKSRCLTHPNIVRFIDFDRDEDLYFIVMEWLEGRTLADILDSADSRSVDHEQSFRIVRQIGKALDYAHRCGIVHADVKPGNIMMMPNGDAKLFDFGVARVQQQQKALDPDFDPGILGALTPAYSSMQVLTGEDPVASDDVFSLACLLYRLIAGYRVFGPRNAAEAAAEGMAPQPLAGLSIEQWNTVKKALSYSRVTRFGTMSEFLRALHGDMREQSKFSPVATTTLKPDAVRHIEFDNSGGSLKWLFGLLALLTLLGFAGFQFGIYDEILKRLNLPQGEIETLPPLENDTPASIPEPTAGQPDEPLEEVALPAIEQIVPFEELPLEESAEPEGDVAPASELSEEDLPPELREAPPFVPPAEAEIELIDFSQLPAADAEIQIRPGAGSSGLRSLILREDEPPVVVDFVRAGPVDRPLTLRIEEISFSGNRSPWRTGQYQISNSGVIEFPPGQDRARLELAMAQDTLREADQQSTLRVRPADSAEKELAGIEVLLEDDDQRRFEAQLPANTIAFAVSQVSVLERDPAVQIDIVRFNPDETSLRVEYTVSDVTATAGEDYFPPTRNSVSFFPGQRSARILIPLVQDSLVEDDEAFVVELSPESTTPNADVHYRIAVMLRDDDGG